MHDVARTWFLYPRRRGFNLFGSSLRSPVQTRDRSSSSNGGPAAAHGPGSSPSAQPQPGGATSCVPVETTLERTIDTRAPAPPCRSIRTPAWVLLAVLIGLAPVAARAEGVAAALLPDTLFVLPDSTVTLTLAIEVADHAFNGYDAVISYDPAALTFLQASPLSLQEGSLMKTACANRFHWFQASGDSLSVSHVLLCNGVSVTGPGTLYTLRFRASHTPQSTVVHVRHIRFYDAGLFVDPSTATDAWLAIGVPVDVPPAGPGPARVRVAPNPCRAAAAIVVEGHRGGSVRLAVCDVQGRVVRRLESGPAAAGALRLGWDLKDERGQRVPPGVYRVLVHGGAGVSGTRVVVLP